MSEVEPGRAKRVRPIWVWDPNPFNPYGGEVARVIGLSQKRVVHISRASIQPRPDGFTRWPLIPRPAEGKRGLWHKVSYGFAIGTFVLAAAVVHPKLVIPWINSKPEATALRLLQRLKIDTYLIVHNPTQSRDDAAQGSLLQRLREDASQLVVHSLSLREGLIGNVPVSIAHHPAYFGWVHSLEACDGTQPVASPAGLKPRILYIGSARRDKGFYELPSLSAEAAKQGANLVISVGRLTCEQAEVLSQCRDAEVVSDGSSYVEDRDLFQHLRASDVVVAPYRDVTMSGTIVLALTMGIPVIAFHSPALENLLPADCLVAQGDFAGMIRRAIAAASTPGQTASALRFDRESAADWRRILDADPRSTSSVRHENGHGS